MESILVLENSEKPPNYGKVSKKIYVKISPEKKTLTGNFTYLDRTFDITKPEKHYKMRHDIFSSSSKKSKANTLDQMLQQFDANKALHSDNPTYEEPRDVVNEKPAKPPRKHNTQSSIVMSPRTISKETKMLLRDQKKKLMKKYESLIMKLMDRCEQNDLLITEKESQLTKLKDKLKSVLEYNNLFAQENDQLKDQHSQLLKYIEDCKSVVQGLETRNVSLMERNRDLEDRVKKFDVPDRDQSEASTAVPLVQVCMSCSSRQIILNQAREHNLRLQNDMHALKDVLYRLNLQLAKYQERLRNTVQQAAGDAKFVHKPTSDTFDSLITTSLGYMNKQGQEGATADDNCDKSGRETPSNAHGGRVADLSSLLSAQALAPLFDAYQDNIQEKENLISDYEKQFEIINIKSKQIVEDNKGYKERLTSLEEECLALNKSNRKLVMERETWEIEKEALLERAEKAEGKLKEVFELYEDKLAAMMRDYETVHREYLTTKNQLASCAGLEHSLRARTVPADLHHTQLRSCQKLLEELRHQYNMENERRAEQITKLQEQKTILEQKYNALCEEHKGTKGELEEALKNVRLYRKAAVIFRQRLKSSNATMSSLRRATRRRRSDAPLRDALMKLERIKAEIKTVKTKAYTSLEELERRIVQQERRATRAEEEHRRELDRAQLVLQHKEDIIRSLIDKVADVEEVRLSQSNAHRLQGIVSDSSSTQEKEDRREENRRDDRKEEKRLTPGHGGYYQNVRKDKRRTSHS